MNAKAVNYIDLSGQKDHINYLHVPQAKIYGGYYFVAYGRDNKDMFGKIGVVNRGNFEVVKELVVSGENRAKAITEIHSDNQGVLFARDWDDSIYRSTDEGNSWLKLDFDRNTKTYSFRSIPEVDDRQRVQGEQAETGQIIVNSSGDLLIYSRFYGPTISVFKAEDSSAQIGAKLSSVIGEPFRNSDFFLTDDKKIIFLNHVRNVAYESEDFGESYTKLVLEKDIVGVTSDGQMLFEGNPNYFLGNNMLKNTSYVDSLTITRLGFMHNFGSIHSRQLKVGQANDMELLETNIVLKDYWQIGSADTLVILKKE
jgi:hypothetical protein